MKTIILNPIRRRRFNRGLTQKEVAEEAGISVKTVIKLENNQTIRPFSRCMKGLGEFFGVTAGRLTEEYLQHKALVG